MEAQKKKESTELDLGELIAKNKGLVSKTFNANPDETPMINGYKMLKDTPQHESREESFPRLRGGWRQHDNNQRGAFRVPNTPLREEIGLQIANRT